MAFVIPSATSSAQSALQAQILQQAEQLAATTPSSGIFFATCRFLSRQLGIDHVLVGELAKPGRQRVIIRANTVAGNGAVPTEYCLNGTPCEGVAGHGLCYFPRNVQALFPDDKKLAQLKVESYLGIPLLDKKQQPLGLLVLMHTATLSRVPFLKQVLELLTPRLQQELNLNTALRLTTTN